MVEITIYGRGGQGGVTLAKLVATQQFLNGNYAQAFGVYAAERSGAPIQAYVRFDSEEITTSNAIVEPDHVIVLDRTLVQAGVTKGMKDDGHLILNTVLGSRQLAELFPGRQIAFVDATAIAVANKLGTRTVPIVNTTMFGAVCKTLDWPWSDVEKTLRELKFKGPNVVAAKAAFESVQRMTAPGSSNLTAPSAPAPRPAGIFDETVGMKPTIRTGSWATRQPHRQELLSPCSAACPAGNDIQGFVAAAGREQYDEALEILLRTTPFPGVCGRVCPAPCMDHCNRSHFDEPVQIRELERHVANRGRRPEPSKPWRETNVAVIGSGPAGLSAAYHLARLGHDVTIFEGGEELGGLLRTGIPAYRLPREVLEREIQFILDHGIHTQTHAPVDRIRLLEMSRDYDAVFVATGQQEVRSLRLGSSDDGNVIQGLEFLDRVRRGFVRLQGESVVVVGGGNTAIDAARSALRVGAGRVHILYRRTRAEMPAISEEIKEAHEEGVAIDELVNPLWVRKNGSSGLVMTCQRMRLGDPDGSGRRQPIPETSEDSHFDVLCDRVILALGQSADLAIFPEGTAVSEGGDLLGLIGAPVFAGGDFASNEGTVTAAIGSGRKAAWHIHQTLTGECLFEPDPKVATVDWLHTHVFEHTPAHQTHALNPKERRRSFSEVRQGWVGVSRERSAVEEAQRCFSCGVCNACDRCVSYCPEGILRRHGDEFFFDYDYCKGCGVCATQCPRGVIYMAEL